jgi:1-acyl-sn-glycerol-3-phosphate acyltransferase
MTPNYLKTGLLSPLWHGILRLLGWRIEMDLPAESKYVLVVAPHTSNWDFAIGIMTAWAIGLPKPRWIGKHTLFKPPFGWIMYQWGGIPVDRSRSQKLVEQVAEHFAREDVFLLALAPEGTRRRTEFWRSGFYYIALSAQVPIVLAFLDFRRKVVGTGPVIRPTGNLEADFEIIREFYSTVQGKYPERQGEIRLRTPNTQADSRREELGATEDNSASQTER